MFIHIIITTILLTVSQTAVPLPPRNLVQDQQPLTVHISIFDETKKMICSYKHNILYSTDEPEHQGQVSFPVHAGIGNYSVQAQLYQQNQQTPVFTITKNLTRHAIIKSGSSNEALMMEAGLPSGKIDQNATYGLHMPTKYSILVIHQVGLIPRQSIYSYKSMFNFRIQRTNQDHYYIAPIDLSQLMVPYKTYKPVHKLDQGMYNMTISIKVYPMLYYSMFYGFAKPQLMRQVNPAMQMFYSDDMIDMLKQALFTNNLYLVITYFILSFTQIFMNIFAFKNQIAVWKKVQEKGGLSIKALYQQLICQLIFCLYLIDNDSNKLFLSFSALNMVLTLWKVKRAVEIKNKQSFPYFTLAYKQWYHQKQQKVDTNAMHYTSYLTAVFFSLFLVYKIHSFWASEKELQIPTLRQAYSLALQLSVGFLMVFGFVLMTPQLYINYKLKSVDHLPWKTLIYRFISTIIDDVFVFMIDLPAMQRVFSFRDDIIFILYLYQRWIYRVDPSRKAHFDQTHSLLQKQQNPSLKQQ